MVSPMPELLSPAGSPEKLRAALLYGADAVYLAGNMFGMRAAAANFTDEELAEAVAYTHARGKKVYLTLNTMPREYEYDALRAYLSRIGSIGLDAFIIADIGVLALVREMLPDAKYEELVSYQGDDLLEGEPAFLFVVERIAAAAKAAWESRTAGTYATGFGRAAVGMCRRVCYHDGSAKMWGDTNEAAFTELEGGNDSGIELMFTYTPDKKLTGVVANVADRIAVMYAGDIIEIGTCEEVFYDPRHPYTWALLSSLPQLGIKGEDLYSIQGTPPNLFYEVKGDAFAPRNPQALKIDFEIRPPYFDVSPTHKARTWLLDPRAPKVEPPEHIKVLREQGVNRHG